MSVKLNNELMYSVCTKSNVPLVFKGYVKNWSVANWDLQKWSSVLGSRELPFRCFMKNFTSDEPCWERKCEVKNMSFENFVTVSNTCPDWMYFDYKYLHKWFSTDTDLFKEVSWQQFGFGKKGAADTTIWIGNSGAHTPAHQDTYGFNIVAQIYGKKRWVLFPPETGGLKPTRVPYEESSIYSELNFFCPNNLDVFKGLTGGRLVELSAGDALLVPRGWWHYVQNIEPVNIALNVWLPHEKDVSAQVSEALIKILVAQICKDLPQETAKLIVNPNEDDISDTPLAVLFLQLETVANIYMDKKRKMRRIKRQRTLEDNTTDPDLVEFDLTALLENKDSKLELAADLSSEELIDLLKDNIKTFCGANAPQDEDDVDGSTASLCLTKAVIDAFSQSNVIDVVKQNLFARLS